MNKNQGAGTELAFSTSASPVSAISAGVIPEEVTSTVSPESIDVAYLLGTVH
jgi:hypothetical protein